MSKKEEEDLIQRTREDPSLMSNLTPRELYVFQEYCMKGGITLNALAVHVSKKFDFDVTGERVRQIKAKAINKIKRDVYLREIKAKEKRLIVLECISAALNIDEKKYVVGIEKWDWDGPSHYAWRRGILDAVDTMRQHFGVEA